MNPATHHPQWQQTALGLEESFKLYEARARRAVSRSDPWQENFHWEVGRALAESVEPLRKEVCAALAGLDEVAALQQAWAVAFSKPFWTGLLYRAFAGAAGSAPEGSTLPADQEQSSPILREARRLRALTVERWKTNPVMPYEIHTAEHRIACLLLGLSPADEPPPDLGDHTRLEGRFRLRYRLAHHFRSGASLSRLLTLAARQKAVTASQRRREMARALEEARRMNNSGSPDGSAPSTLPTHPPRRLRPLRELEFILLEEKERALAVQLRPWWPVLLSRPLQEHRDLPGYARALDQERTRVQQLLSSLMAAARSRRLREVDALVSTVGESPIACHLVQGLAKEPWGLQEDYAHPARKPEFGQWEPMSPRSLATLQQWAPSELPRWWAMKSWQVTQWLLMGGPDMPTPQMLPQDLAPLQRTWCDSELIALIRAGHGRLVPDNARAWEELSLEELARLGPRLFQRGRMQLARRLSQLPDARPWLVLMASQRREDGSWDDSAARALRELAEESLQFYARGRWPGYWGLWVSQTLGTPEWEAVRTVAMERTCPVADASGLFSQRKQPIDPQAMRLVVARSLHEKAYLPGKPAGEVLLWVKFDPLAAPVLVEHAPRAIVLKAATKEGEAARLLREAIGGAP